MKAGGLSLDFNPKDDELARLEGRCFNQPWCAAAYRALRRNPHVEAWLPRSPEGEAIGLVSFQMVGGEAELFRIAVVPERRGEGWGRLLLDEFVARCGERGASVFYLEVRAGNVAAIRLYDAAGFRRLGVRAKYFQDPVEDALIYRLNRQARTPQATARPA